MRNKILIIYIVMFCFIGRVEAFQDFDSSSFYTGNVIIIDSTHFSKLFGEIRNYRILPHTYIGLLETNGHQYYKNWDTMMTYHPRTGATWMQAKERSISHRQNVLWRVWRNFSIFGTLSTNV